MRPFSDQALAAKSVNISYTSCCALLSWLAVCRLEARLNRTQGRLGDALTQAAELRRSSDTTPSGNSSQS